MASSTPSNLPALLQSLSNTGNNNNNATFIPKLYLMVNDPGSPQIHWSKNGAFFIIPSPEEFSQTVLPIQYKHNNFASFVRQLNMYGFHKVADLSQMADSGSTRAWAFEHPCFARGRPELLEGIHRKPKSAQRKLAAAAASSSPPSSATSGPQRAGTPASPPAAELHPSADKEEQRAKAKLLIEELVKTREQQRQINLQFAKIQEEKEVLWSEYANTQRHLHEQREVTKKVLSFLTALFHKHQQQQAAQLPAPSSAAPAASFTPSSGPLGTLSGPPAPQIVELDDSVLPASSSAFSPAPFDPLDGTDAMDLDPPSSGFSGLGAGGYYPAAADASLSRDFSTDFDEFSEHIFRFEDSNVPPYCSTDEEGRAWYSNAPLGVPS